MRIALAQINPTVGDLEGNGRLVAGYVEQAQRAGARMVVFPELAISGYPPEDLLLKQHFLTDCAKTLADVAERCEGITAVVGVPWREDGSVYNAAAVLSGGGTVAVYRKVCLPNYAVFDEKRYFTPGDCVLVIDMGGRRVAVNICEDIWDGGTRSIEGAAAGGAHVVVNLSMSPYHVAKGRVREQLLSKRARQAQAYVCYANGVGGQDELVFDGQSVVLSPDGSLLARARQFEEELLLVDLADSDGAGELPPVLARGADGSIDSDLVVDVVELPSPAAAARATVISVPLPVKSVPAEPPTTTDTPVRRGVAPALPAEAEVYQALCLGVRDYVHKNGFSHVVLGLSGGVDSALTACVARDALGSDGVTAVSMPSRFSSIGTKSDARETAARLGIEFHEIAIESLFQSYLESLSALFPTGTQDVTEQNIQARIRGNLLMALSNKFGWLVLTTGNKSEMAVGYATLYGDMAGGFAVLKDVPKTLVYRLSRHRNSLAAESEGPIPESTLDRAPSAELAEDQTDQEVLPPYEVLDRIVEAYVEDDQSVEAIARTGIAQDEVERVVSMIDGNEYKRRQAAPGVRITSKAFGKDRRLPITNRYRG